MTTIIDPFDKHYSVTIVHNLTGRKIVLGKDAGLDLIEARALMMGRVKPRLSLGMRLQQMGAVWFIWQGETLRYGMWVSDTRMSHDNAVASTPVLSKREPEPSGPWDKCDRGE